MQRLAFARLVVDLSLFISDTSSFIPEPSLFIPDTFFLYTRYCEEMLSLRTTRRMVSANMSFTESCFTFEQRLV